MPHSIGRSACPKDRKGSQAAIMAEAKARDHEAAVPRLSWRLAGLLLAGTMFAGAPAIAQQRTADETATFQEPLDPLVENTGNGTADATAGLPVTETTASVGGSGEPA
ncbi:MAG TPA: hypothetical protein VLG73_06995, partial [Shinella sp.]|nr:hypothetical protein [Shinella sp.]